VLLTVLVEIIVCVAAGSVTLHKRQLKENCV
jgi:hypothetical protein